MAWQVRPGAGVPATHVQVGATPVLQRGQPATTVSVEFGEGTTVNITTSYTPTHPPRPSQTPHSTFTPVLTPGRNNNGRGHHTNTHNTATTVLFNGRVVPGGQ